MVYTFSSHLPRTRLGIHWPSDYYRVLHVCEGDPGARQGTSSIFSKAITTNVYISSSMCQEACYVIDIHPLLTFPGVFLFLINLYEFMWFKVSELEQGRDHEVAGWLASRTVQWHRLRESSFHSDQTMSREDVGEKEKCPVIVYKTVIQGIGKPGAMTFKPSTELSTDICKQNTFESSDYFSSCYS